MERRAKADEYFREAQGWPHSKPTPEQREKPMKRVLALHVAVARVERETPET